MAHSAAPCGGSRRLDAVDIDDVVIA